MRKKLIIFLLCSIFVLSGTLSVSADTVGLQVSGSSQGSTSSAGISIGGSSANNSTSNSTDTNTESSVTAGNGSAGSSSYSSSQTGTAGNGIGIVVGGNQISGSTGNSTNSSNNRSSGSSNYSGSNTSNGSSSSVGSSVSAGSSNSSGSASISQGAGSSSELSVGIIIGVGVSGFTYDSSDASDSGFKYNGNALLSKDYTSYTELLSRIEEYVELKQEGYDAKTAAAITVDGAEVNSSTFSKTKITVLSEEAESFYEVWRSYDGDGLDIIEEGLKYVGSPYVWGGSSLTNGVDCSHYVWLILERTGHYFGKYETSYGIRSWGEEVTGYRDIQPGDVLCWRGHVAFYLGENYILQASSPELGVCVTKLDTLNIKGGLITVRRFVS